MSSRNIQLRAASEWNRNKRKKLTPAEIKKVKDMIESNPNFKKLKKQPIADNATEMTIDEYKAYKKENQKPVNKYRNKKKKVGRMTFDSTKEYKRWLTLSIMQQAGLIQDLERQVKYKFVINDVLICTYIADFRYKTITKLKGENLYIGTILRVVVEDVKSKPTKRLPEYVHKKKLMQALYGITIKET